MTTLLSRHLTRGSLANNHTVFVDCPGCGSCQLGLFLGLLLNLGNLLPLLGRSRDLHTEDDVTDLRLGQGSYIYTEK